MGPALLTAPASSRDWQTSIWPLAAARCRGVWPPRAVRLAGSAPACSSTLTTALRPRSAALCNAVIWVCPRESTGTPLDSSAATAPRSPRSDADHSFADSTTSWRRCRRDRSTPPAAQVRREAGLDWKETCAVSVAPSTPLVSMAALCLCACYCWL
eukprot:SAG25_NODE_699_length_5883_cov_3.452282_2_plen_156_part_00